MGQVFLALSPGGQPAAVKVIRQEFARDAEFGRRFASEVGAVRRVRGAHLAPLPDADPQAERPWLATTYVAGPTLRDLVAEQAAGRAVGPASDVFALGSTLYFLATGREAFAAENEWAVAHRVVADDPDVSALPPPLRRLITACLHKDPDRRPAPAQVLTCCEDELGVALGPGAWMGSPVPARRSRRAPAHCAPSPPISSIPRVPARRCVRRPPWCQWAA